MRQNARILLCSLLLVMASACEPEECTDPVACQTLKPFEYDPSCELTGELQVELGHGETSYSPFEPGGPAPEAHTGGQGGMHIFVAVRVLNAALDRYGQLLAEIKMTTPIPGCDPTTSGNDCTYLRAVREVTLGYPGALRINSQGQVEEVGIIFFDPGSSTALNTLSVSIEDPCRRRGQASAVFSR